MKWFCFLFWFVWRLVLACLAHFNWSVAMYTNCIYFSMWKSYDLLWFWMHLVLCACFKSLRRENYLIVWCNLIIKRCTTYPHHSFREIYLALYGGVGTKAERALERIQTLERRDQERASRRAQRIRSSDVDASSSSSDEEDPDAEPYVYQYKPPAFLTAAAPSLPEVLEEEERECRKYAYVGEAEQNGRETGEKDVERGSPSGVRYPSLEEEQAGGEGAEGAATSPTSTSAAAPNGDDSGEESDGSGSNARSWLLKVPGAKAIKTRLARGKAANRGSSTSVPSAGGGEKGEGEQPDRPGADGESVSTWARIRGALPSMPSIPRVSNPFNRSVSQDADGTALDILRPDYTNSRDIVGWDEKAFKQRRHREKREKKSLERRVRRRLKEELREAARIERQRKKVADSIELMLQLLRMMTSFAILVGNIRKTFIPAQFKYLKPGQHPYDNYELLILFRFTTFMDVSMFWINVMWVYCLQWHLCCRLGIVRFWTWTAVLIGVASVVMLIPMRFAQAQMDLSWCRFAPGTFLADYQPSW